MRVIARTRNASRSCSTNHPSGTGPQHRDCAEGEIAAFSWISGPTQQVGQVLQGSRVLATAAHGLGAGLEVAENLSQPHLRDLDSGGISVGHSLRDPHGSPRNLGLAGSWAPGSLGVDG